MRPLLSAMRLMLGLLVFGAIGWQFRIHIGLGFPAINFFSYFTNLSNLFAASVFVASALRGFGERESAEGFDQVRFVSLVNMVIVGIVFSVLLRKVDLGSLLPWINVLLHYVMPVVVVIDWLVDPPATRLGNSVLTRIEIVPALYLVYVLIRGGSTGWYPYPFMNPGVVAGYGAVAMYSVGIAVTFLLVGWGLLKIRITSAAPIAAAVIVSASLAAFARPASLQAQGLPRYTATRELTIDGEIADLVPVGALVVDGRGSMYVMQTQDHKILVFDSLGVLFRTIGRKGSGPGEFLGLGNIGFVGDTLWAWDGEKLRLTFFKPDGKPSRSTNILRITGEQMRFATPMIRGVRADASVLSASIRHQPREAVEVFADSKGQTIRELASRPMAEGGVFSFGSYDAGKFNPFGDPNPPVVVGAKDASRIAVATAILAGDSAGVGSVTMLTYTGDTLFTRRYPIAIKPVPASLIDSTLDAMGKKNPKYAEQVQRYPRASIYPPLEYMRMSRDGSLLLAFYTDGHERDFFIINAKGDIEAQLTLPSEIYVKTFDNEHLWGTIRNADDLESIVRLKLVKDSRTPP